MIYTVLIKCCVVNRQHDLIRDVLQDMEMRGIDLDVHFGHILIQSCLHSNKLEEAVDVIELMMKHAQRPMVRTLTQISLRLAKEKRRDLLQRLIPIVVHLHPRYEIYGHIYSDNYCIFGMV